MKLCNFRPLCWLALIVVSAIGSAMLSAQCALVMAVVLCVVLWFAKVPDEFKIVVLTVFGVAVLSYVLTTCLVPNPYYHTYDPNAGLRGVVRGYVRWYLPMFLSTDNANLIYAMLFGDKSALTWGLRNDFSASGLAHMLAVSGLHVGLLFWVVSTLLKVCRVPRRAHVWIVAPLLIFYAYLCGWQYAVMRAVIMCLVYAAAKRNLRVADPLSVLSLAAIIILLIFPYALVSVSFLLSFACVLGIILWYQTVYRVIPSQVVAMYVAVTLGSLPFVVYFFGAVPVLGIVTNVILVPLLVLSFYLGMFAVSTFVCGAVLWLAEPLLNFVRWITRAIGQLPWATIHVSHSFPAVVVYLLGSLILSRFVFLKPKVKYSLAAVLFTCYLVFLVV
ncbi:MAG: ComEC/Rec2 family competence protein [Clostridia bacterium]|nr:ComEC/Rec2 family competence protein [Clostridia bacterium]